MLEFAYLGLLPSRAEPDSSETITFRKIAIIQNYQHPLHQTVQHKLVIFE